MLSMASDGLLGITVDQLRSDADYSILTKILEYENVIVCVAGYNNGERINKTLNENVNKQDKGEYKSASVNSLKNNKITVVGYNPANSNVFWENNDSALPVGFDNVK